MEENRNDSEDGLSSEEARRRLTLYGPNLLPRPQGERPLWKFLKNFFNFFALLLWAAAALCLAPGVDLPPLALAIALVVVVNGLFAFLQEEKSGRAVERLRALLAPRCRVVRDGAATDMDAAGLVPGDVILLGEGDRVPADARLVESAGVEVDNSVLTGESVFARRYKSEKPWPGRGSSLRIELPDLVFAGTTVVKGQGRALVFATGLETEVGTIARLTASVKTEPSPLQRQLQGTVRVVAFVAGVVGVSLLLVGWLVTGLTFVQALVFFIGLFVANVPEGLLPTVTLSLAMGVSRMARRNVLVKTLSSVETLGCVTVICCDKTGTLTENRMTVVRLFADGVVHDVTGGGDVRGDIREGGRALTSGEIQNRAALAGLLECAVLCNNARLRESTDGVRVLGDPTEGALLVLAAKARVRPLATRLGTNVFDAVRKRMSVVVERKAGQRLVYVKGAPGEVLERCNRVLWRGAVRSMEAVVRRRIAGESDALAGRGLRVLAFAFRRGANPGQDAEALEDGLVFLGLAALRDPVRAGVDRAVGACRRAGIRVLMVTGDHALTAAAVGREIGLSDRAPPVTGAELAAMTDAELKTVLSKGERIFARVAPDHKLRVVSLLKELGETVAVTGDGVNDAPALRRADVGVAMGHRGHDVAREAAHIVLTDDNFSSIVAAIEEGRAVYDNLKRFVAYILNSNPQEMYPYILWMLIPGMPLAMTVMGVLAVDVGTDLLPALGLGAEPPAADVMERPPRPRREKLLTVPLILQAYFVQGTLVAVSCFATYLYAGWALGFWRPGLPLTAMPAAPPGLNMSLASAAYLQTLTAYFFPTVTTQIANVLCKRSGKASLFSKDFLTPGRRREFLDAVAGGGRGGRCLAGWMARHPVLTNFVSNPLLNLGIAAELLLCGLFFYTPLSRVYFFAPVPWHVYVFALHGPLVLLAFEEAKKWVRRRGWGVAFLG